MLMDWPAATAIVSGCAMVITAIIKWVPSAKKTGIECGQHSRLLERLAKGDEKFVQFEKRLDRIEKRVDETGTKVAEIHARVVR